MILQRENKEYLILPMPTTILFGPEKYKKSSFTHYTM